MKLLIQADDYGITRAVSSGIVFGIHHGLVRNTGIFTNMDWTEECLDMIKPYLDQIDLGIDLNISTGRPILPTYQIPTLVNQEGIFLTSWESRKRDEFCENQINSSLSQYLLNHKNELLQKEYCLVVGHMGYVDDELLKLSSYHLYRIKDLEGITNLEVMDWVKESHISLIRYSEICNHEKGR